MFEVVAFFASGRVARTAFFASLAAAESAAAIFRQDGLSVPRVRSIRSLSDLLA